MSQLSERLSQEPRPTALVGPRPEAAYYQKHPIKGQQAWLFPEEIVARLIAKHKEK